MQEKQDKILNQVIKLVPFEGWSNSTLKQAARDAGFDENYAQIIFKNGAIDAIALFMNRINEESFAKINEENLKTMKIREKIFHILDTRFTVMEEYKAVIRKTLQHLAMPQNMLQGAKLLWDMADKIWYKAGDSSADFNYYTKRTTLMAVYSSTLLFWLEDESENHNATQEFLKRRIENVMQFEKVKSKIKNFANR